MFLFVLQAYAEIEVMKMVMSVSASEAGSVFYAKRPGAVLDAGDIIAHLEVDDASLITKAQLYKDQFPEVSNSVAPEKLNHIHINYKGILENTLAGKTYYISHFLSWELFGGLSYCRQVVGNHWTKPNC